MRPPQPRRYALGWLFLVLCSGGLLAADISWRELLRVAVTNHSGWFGRLTPGDPRAVETVTTSAGDARVFTSLSMDRMLHALLFSRPANGWRLENSNRELTSAWLARPSTPLTTETRGDTFSAAFFPTGFLETSPSGTSPVPTDPDGQAPVTGIWISNASGNWGTMTNWQNGTIPEGASAEVRFDRLDITTDVTVTNEVPRTIGTMFLGDTNGTNSYNITGATLTFENAFGGVSTLDQLENSAGDTISAPLLLANDLFVFNLSSNILTLSGAISSSAPENESAAIQFRRGNINVTGNITDAINRPVAVRVSDGVVTLSGTNTYSRPTSVDGGTLLVNGDNSAATGTVFVRGQGSFLGQDSFLGPTGSIQASSVLGGTGTIGGDVVMLDSFATITGGTVTTVGALTMQQDLLMVTGDGSGGTYLANLSGATSDLLAIAGQFVLGQGSTLDIQGTADGVSTYILATFGSHSDTFQFVSGIPDNYLLVYHANDLELVPIPEPATWIGGGLALAAIAFARTRKKLKRQAV